MEMDSGSKRFLQKSMTLQFLRFLQFLQFLQFKTRGYMDNEKGYYSNLYILIYIIYIKFYTLLFLRVSSELSEL